MAGGSESWLSWVFKVVNFGILVAILVKFAGKPLKDYLQSRSAAIRDRMEEGDRLFREADALKTEYEARLASLDQQIESFKKTILAETERERKKILDEAEVFASRIKEQAALTYEQEIREVKSKIKEEIARLTMEHAEKLVLEKFDQKDHDRLVEEFIEKLRSLN
ncbi:MAG: ATP synthase subunit b, sodium ion specific [Syntrophorhabdus sp. PtaU1.Bin050]|nr:MAG: ATP synthase subunit b, sodium ion specific [Syntrophorhabdus sp. PtaU1.Bin050]